MQRTVLLSQFHLSVRLSVNRMLCEKTKQCTADSLIPHERAITLVFWHQHSNSGWWAMPLSLWNIRQKWPTPLRKTPTSRHGLMFCAGTAWRIPIQVVVLGRPVSPCFSCLENSCVSSAWPALHITTDSFANGDFQTNEKQHFFRQHKCRFIRYWISTGIPSLSNVVHSCS